MMLGHGDIASVLPKRDDLLFFASGVSNSQERRQSEYRREVDLLLQQPRDNHVVYFSSLAIFYSDTPYTRHKVFMETLVKKLFPTYTIFRIGNITWGKNPHTLINYLRAHPEAEIQDVYRYILSKEEFLHWVAMIPEWSCEINVPGRMLKVRQIVDEYVKK